MSAPVSPNEVENLIASLLVVRCMEGCQGSTAGSILTALDAAGLEVVRRRNDGGVHQEMDPFAVIDEICERRGLSRSKLASLAGLMPSTILKPFKNSDRTQSFNLKTLNKIIAWDNAQGGTP